MNCVEGAGHVEGRGMGALGSGHDARVEWGEDRGRHAGGGESVSESTGRLKKEANHVAGAADKTVLTLALAHFGARRVPVSVAGERSADRVQGQQSHVGHDFENCKA